MFDLPELTTITSTCVTVPERLDYRQPKILDPKMRVRGRYADLDHLVCDKENEAGCRAIGPLLLYDHYHTPTVKHHCPKVSLAASLRAMSNQVEPDPVIFAEFENWWRIVYIPKIIELVKYYEIYVCLTAWANRQQFTGAYRRMLFELFKPENHTHEWVRNLYNSFVKVEMSPSGVPHEYKNTPLNDVKERQIWDPLPGAKIRANPVCNKFEELFHYNVPQYCGRKNWLDIAKDIETATADIPDIIFGAADGSGFDMTQLPCHNALMNELFSTILDLPTFLLDPRLDKSEIKHIFKDAMYMNVSVDRGELKFRAQGRASGDGWTTVGNTILMISYWEFCFDRAGVPKHLRFLRVKGDDVLLALSKKYLPQFETQRKLLFTMTKDRQQYGLGQICKKMDYGCITELDFLSCYFFYTKEGRLRLTRIPERVFQTIMYTTKYTSRDTILTKKQLLYSKGASLLSWSRGLPIFEPLARKMMDLGVKGKRTDVCYYTDTARVWHDNLDREAYVDFLEQRYGISARQVDAIEEKISRIAHIDDHQYIPELAMFFNKS